MFKLIVRTGSQTGKEVSLDRPALRLGRGSGNDVVLQDSQASRQHAEISRQGDQFYIRDLGSMNGTYVNNERVTAARLLQPGDQVRIGDTVLSCELVGAGAAPSYASGWEAGVWSETAEQAAPADGRGRLMIWALAGVLVVLLLVAGFVVWQLLREPATPPPVAEQPMVSSPTSQVVVVTPTAEAVVQPTATQAIVPTSAVVVPTVAIKATVPAAKPPAVPTSMPVAAGGLEKLPAVVAAALPGVSAEQLPQALGAQIQTMSPDQLRVMVGALFPGVDPARLPQVIAASFPGMPAADVQVLLGTIFPGQALPAPATGPVGGRLVLGIYDKGQDRHDLYLANAMGGQPTLLTELASEPDFSPDGQWVVYFSWADDHLGLRLIKTDGTGDTGLTTVREHGYPSFSPDGGRISFYNNERAILHVVNRDGTGMRDIGQGEFPAWSPVGDQIAYRGCLGGGRCGLIVANADGSNPRQITTHANDAAPRWSPNGGQIAFHSDRDGNWEIYVINSDGSWLRRITMHQATDVMPVWSPDGLRIAFRSDRGGSGAVWVTSGIGGGATKMFDADFDPTWPDLAQMDWTR